VVEVRVGQQNGFERAVPGSIGRGMQRRKGTELGPDIGRGVDEKPTPAIATDGNARLRLGLNYTRPNCQAIPAGTVPLGQTAARCGSKDADANSDSGDFLVGDLGRVGGAFHRNAHVFHLGFDPLFFSFGVFHKGFGCYYAHRFTKIKFLKFSEL